ncbi:MAG TPA: 3-isopropylmalate dehydratase [Gallicola sp.]|jgi:3-isopropylmalate/(R)-2-methylmalate dehydratase small subunit|nr:3-isopropylmalate dehydratase [Gallicola sp.]
MKIKGRVLKYGDNINTDIISPPQYMELSIEEASKYSMTNIDPEFPNKVQKGDIMVGGSNFGSGSSRETSPLTLKHLGIVVVISKFFARIFYRNCINIGLIPIECEEVDKINDNDILEIEVESGTINNLTTGDSYKCSAIPSHLLEIIEDGGLVSNLKKQLAKNNGDNVQKIKYI